MHARSHTHSQTWIHTHSHTRVHTHALTNDARTHARTPTHTHTHTHTHTYTYISPTCLTVESCCSVPALTSVLASGLTAGTTVLARVTAAYVDLWRTHIYVIFFPYFSVDVIIYYLPWFDVLPLQELRCLNGMRWFKVIHFKQIIHASGVLIIRIVWYYVKVLPWAAWEDI